MYTPLIQQQYKLSVTLSSHCRLATHITNLAFASSTSTQVLTRAFGRSSGRGLPKPLRTSTYKSVLNSFGCTAALVPYRMSATHRSPMLEADLQRVIQLIHNSPSQACIYATGGGMQALTWLLTSPGASKTILETQVPYAPSALVGILGQVPTTAACSGTAANLADAAYRKASSLTRFGTPMIGIGCTCALATDRTKKGDHKVMLAAQSQQGCTSWEVVLCKGSRSRMEEDELASRLLVVLLAEFADVSIPKSLDNGLAADKETLKVHRQPYAMDAKLMLEGLLQGSIKSVEFAGELITVNAPRHNRVYLPGSFNPLHDGHKKLLAAAVNCCGEDMEGCYEISVGNPDKGLMDIDEIQRRVKPFQESGTPLVVVQAPLFTEKAALFPGSIFVIGYDTAVRLVDDKYYSSDDPMAVQNLFEAILEDEFRMDISSTELRKAAAS